MRVLHVNQDRGTSPTKQKGAAIHVLAMREAFRRAGAEVVALDLHRPEELDRALAELEDVDLVYERHALATDLASRFAERRGVPYALEVNAPLGEEEARWRGGPDGDQGHDVERANLRRADLVLCVSDAVADYARRLGADAGRVAVRPNGVDATRFRPRDPNDPLRAELVPAGRLALGFHGRLRPWHGIERLLDAATAALAAGVDVHFVFVGVGGDHPEIERFPADRRTVVPWVDHAEVGRYVACFDLAPLSHPPDLPFYFSPLKLAEAMAAGVVPVVPRLGDLDRVVRDGWSGRVYDPEDPDALARAIVELSRDDDARRELARNGRASASGNSWEAIARFVLARAGLEPRADR